MQTQPEQHFKGVLSPAAAGPAQINEEHGRKQLRWELAQLEHSDERSMRASVYSGASEININCIVS